MRESRSKHTIYDFGILKEISLNNSLLSEVETNYFHDRLKNLPVIERTVTELSHMAACWQVEVAEMTIVNFQSLNQQMFL